MKKQKNAQIVKQNLIEVKYMYKKIPLREKVKSQLISGSPTKDEDNDVLYFQHPDNFPFPMQHKDDVELENRGIIIIDQYICKETLAKAYKRLLAIHFDETFTDEVQIILNSPGGQCDAGWAFIDLMGFVKNPIKTIAMGEVCSMATHIFIAGDHRVVAPNTSAMIHQFSDYGEGNYGDLIAKQKGWKLEMEKDIAHLIRCSKYTSRSQVEKNLLKGNDNWLSPKEMKKHGLCEEIFKPAPRGSKSKKK
jgi:ATP-dependent protease ClpP protease subunit